MVLATATKRTEELWPTVTMAYFAIMRFLTLEYNVSAVGKQWTAATLTAVVLSVVAGPATYVVVIVWNGGVEAVWVLLMVQRQSSWPACSCCSIGSPIWRKCWSGRQERYGSSRMATWKLV